MKYEAQIADKTYEITIEDDGNILFEGRPIEASLLQVGPLGLYSLVVDHQSFEVVVEETSWGYRVLFGDSAIPVRVFDERQLRLAGQRQDLLIPSGEVTIDAPIPGLIIRILVEEGQEVKQNQPVALLEAMKMENELRAPRAGTIGEIKVQPGESVEQGTPLIVLH